MDIVIEPHAPSHRFKRLIAFVVDVLFILLVLILFYPLSGTMEKLGPAARLLPALIFVLYFSVLESNGRSTLGRKILSLRLARLDKKPISFGFSFLRAALLLIPVYADFLGSLFPSTNSLDALHLMSAALIEVAFTFVPLFHPQGRTLPDLFFKTWVHERAEAPIAGPRRWTDTSKVVCAVVVVAVSSVVTWSFLAMLSTIGPTMSETPKFKAISEMIQKKVQLDVPTVGYSVLTVNDKPVMFGLDAVVVIPYSVYQDDLQLENLKTQIFPIMKREVNNPEVDTLRIQFLSRRYIGLLPFEIKKYAMKKVVDVDLSEE